MCGRYSLSIAPEQLAAHFNAALPTQIVPRLNAAPTEDLPVLLNEGEREIQMLRWGLIPHWADDSSIGSKMINARAETIDEKPSFREPFKKHRCLVLADGFYEWQKLPNGKKQPMHISLKSGEPFAFAGLWGTWRSKEGEVIRSFTIITTAPNALMVPIHDRMPVILQPEGEEAWLDKGADKEHLRTLLTAYPAELMQVAPASYDVLKQHGN